MPFFCSKWMKEPVYKVKRSTAESKAEAELKLFLISMCDTGSVPANRLLLLQISFPFRGKEL